MKIEATLANARAVLDLREAGETLDDLLWSFAPPGPRAAPASMGDLPAKTAESAAMAKELKRRGFRFVGPTTAYAFMQAAGLVNDHLAGCAFRD
jgi:DNA-3-methyladenine glycosylase I